MVVDPPVCPVTYQCISVTGPDSRLSCLAPAVGLNTNTGTIRFTSTDSQAYYPGEYVFTVRASSGTVNAVTDEFTFTLRMEDPCKESNLIPLQGLKFVNVRYMLGRDQISQRFTVEDLVEVNVQHDCGRV